MTVDVEKSGHVALVTLDRPDKRNAFDPDQTAALDDALNELDDDGGTWVILLASSGSVFSAGTDLAKGSGGRTGRGGFYGVTDRQRRTPLIAVVEGPAVGGGFEVVLACDLVVASTNASFALPEVSRGVIATCGALFRAPRALTPMVAAELLLTGDPIDAERALTFGLVNRLCKPGEALEGARRLADRICENSPTAVAATLRALHTSVGRSITSAGPPPPTPLGSSCRRRIRTRASGPSSSVVRLVGRIRADLRTVFPHWLSAPSGRNDGLHSRSGPRRNPSTGAAASV